MSFRALLPSSGKFFDSDIKYFLIKTLPDRICMSSGDLNIDKTLHDLSDKELEIN
jgi:hypothetical protein